MTKNDHDGLPETWSIVEDYNNSVGAKCDIKNKKTVKSIASLLCSESKTVKYTNKSNKNLTYLPK